MKRPSIIGILLILSVCALSACQYLELDKEVVITREHEPSTIQEQELAPQETVLEQEEQDLTGLDDIFSEEDITPPQLP